jgi:hypothetical protein
MATDLVIRLLIDKDALLAFLKATGRDPRTLTKSEFRQFILIERPALAAGAVSGRR